ncbi:MAG: ATP-dependent DNA helicase [Proteocatella sp.]
MEKGNKTSYKVSVKELVNYTMLTGDIDSRFTTNASAMDGIRLHKKLQKKAGDNYKSEVTLSYMQEYEDFSLLIQGRADGIITEKTLGKEEQITIDEIKTTKRPLDMIDDEKQIHSAQAKCYGYIYALQNQISKINIRVTYCHVITEEVKLFENTYELEQLEEFFKKLTRAFEKKLRFTNAWQTTRNDSLKELAFPFPDYRKNQREMAVTVYKNLKNQNTIYLQAPTGIGKTISTIFPSLKYMGHENGEKIFYLTSKTTIRKVAEDTVELISQNGARLKCLTITAKDKMCFMEKTNCIPQYCPYAKGYFDRRRKAVEEILQKEDKLGKETVDKYAKSHTICPFEFQLDIAMEADIIICDYNYLFDPNVALKRMFGAELVQNNYTFLVDEAHNLPERAREMYSAQLEENPVKELRKLFKNSDKEVEAALKKLASFINRMKKKYLIDEASGEPKESCIESEIPEKTSEELRKFNKSIEEYLLENNQDEKSEKLTELYFDVMRFQKTIELFDDSYLMYMEESPNFKLKLYCLDPSDKIKAAISQGRSTVFFSATLIPTDYFTGLLGYNEENAIASFESPFDPQNRKILIAPDVSTKYRNRQYSYEKVADYIDLMTSARKGNYMIFFPSYKYMNTVYELYAQKYLEEEAVADEDLEMLTCEEALQQNLRCTKEKALFRQKGDMSQEEREEFLQRFEENPEKTHVAFCVMGGVFSEGIDLKGERLIGVAIVGVGLPQVCLEREIINRYFKEKKDKGFEYAYTYPGINKVLQSSGRLIRTMHDKGVILLIDERYMEAQYQRLLPKDWYPCRRIDLKNISQELQSFWHNNN